MLADMEIRSFIQRWQSATYTDCKVGEPINPQKKDCCQKCVGDAKETTSQPTAKWEIITCKRWPGVDALMTSSLWPWIKTDTPKTLYICRNVDERQIGYISNRRWRNREYLTAKSHDFKRYLTQNASIVGQTGQSKELLRRVRCTSLSLLRTHGTDNSELRQQTC